ncbi:hypothetical protein OG279_26280 [Streptomyces sp. NBC_01201]|uniref:hypothetical protein n=1 Tax=unclassified Streptomyces TaxID=2593676 RepID=UPI002E14CE77|nr:hypothetical protein OG725_24530 [Streptomyces sp. NBC_01213]WSQ82795.1 hypothetical protein OG725_37475 [Streptomyces sp. NBC_01213]WSR50928.1 hypothetical protein OG279_26280 [Streptomyces sp. NBC_01201]
MALDPLATVADLAALGLPIETDELTVANRYLAVASTAVREAAGSPISQTTSRVTLEGERDQRLRLPGSPVTAVTEVVLDGKTVTDWRLRSDRLWRFGGWSAPGEPSEVEVTYTHGLPEVPDDIIDLVGRLVAGAMASYRAEDGGASLGTQVVTSERIGDYAVTYGGDGLATDMELPAYLRERLAARFGGGMSLMRSR